MLNYNKKTARKHRLTLRDMIKPMRGPVHQLNYPDRDIKAAVSDIYVWSTKSDSLPQVLRRAYDLRTYLAYNFEDLNSGTTTFHEADEDGNTSEAFSLTEDQLELAYDLDAFCALAQRICREGGVDPSKAYMLADGSFAPRPASRTVTGTRREGFHRCLAEKDSVEDYKTQRLAEIREELACEVEIPSCETPEELQEVMDLLLEAFNTRTKKDNFSYDPAQRLGGVVYVKRSADGSLSVAAFDHMYVQTHSKQEIVGIIYIKTPMMYNDPNEFCYGLSYTSSLKPVADSIFRQFGMEDTHQQQVPTEDRVDLTTYAQAQDEINKAREINAKFRKYTNH